MAIGMGLSPVPPRVQGTVVVRQDRPAYKIVDKNGFFGPDHVLYPYGSLVYWDEKPNQNMEPLNQLAVDNMVEYLEELDAEGRKVAAQAGKGYSGLADAFTNAQALEHVRNSRVQLVDARETTPLMGDKRQVSTIEKIETVQDAPLTTGGKFSVNQPQTESKPKPGSKPGPKPRYKQSLSLTRDTEHAAGRAAVNQAISEKI